MAMPCLFQRLVDRSTSDDLCYESRQPEVTASGVVWLPWQRDNERTEQDGRRR